MERFQREKEKRWIFTRATTGLDPGLCGHVLFPKLRFRKDPYQRKHEEPPRMRGVLNKLVFG